MNFLGSVENGSGGQELSRMRRHIFDQDQRHVTNITFPERQQRIPQHTSSRRVGMPPVLLSRLPVLLVP